VLSSRQSNIYFPERVLSVLRQLGCAALVVFIFTQSLRASVVDVTSPTTSWTAVQYSNSTPDPSSDQQTGSSEGDIVGNSLHPSFYTTFGDAGTLSLTDGTIGFRMRLGADVNPAGFKTALFVGIDANGDGAIDLFVGVNNSGAADTIGIWNPGNGANISPNTTTIVSTPLMSYAQVAANYHWAPVNTTIDPTVGTATDIDGGGQNDYFLTFSLPFSDVITQLSTRGIAGVDQNSTFSYVMATATQANSLNQDLNGVGKNYDGSATWSTLGALADPISASGMIVPESSTGFATAAVAFAAITAHYLNRYRARRSAPPA
jgi:hypothetical protein